MSGFAVIDLAVEDDGAVDLAVDGSGEGIFGAGGMLTAGAHAGTALGGSGVLSGAPSPSTPADVVASADKRMPKAVDEMSTNTHVLLWCRRHCSTVLAEEIRDIIKVVSGIDDSSTNKFNSSSAVATWANDIVGINLVVVPHGLAEDVIELRVVHEKEDEAPDQDNA
ncbi:hypothetical protein LTR81_007187 [Elasticomyces elasticus]